MIKTAHKNPNWFESFGRKNKFRYNFQESSNSLKLRSGDQNNKRFASSLSQLSLCMAHLFKKINPIDSNT